MKNVIKLIEAKNLRFLAIALLVSAIGFSMLSCEDDAGGPGGGGGGGGLTVTGIPSEYNGRFASFSSYEGVGVGGRTLSGYQSIGPLRRSRISGGRATIPAGTIVGNEWIRYSGNDTITILVSINTDEEVSVLSGQILTTRRFYGVRFSNGNAAIAWSDGD